MPLYSFKCNSCGQQVELFLSLGELNRGVAACPVCKSKDLQGPLAGDEPSATQGAACFLGKKS
jgi:putative FmdB family regulatory protein